MSAQQQITVYEGQRRNPMADLRMLVFFAANKVLRMHICVLRIDIQPHICVLRIDIQPHICVLRIDIQPHICVLRIDIQPYRYTNVHEHAHPLTSKCICLTTIMIALTCLS